MNHLRLDDLVILSGACLQISSDCYAKIIEKWKGARVCLDTSGEPLRHGVPAHPFVLKINQQEAEEPPVIYQNPSCLYTVLQQSADFNDSFLRSLGAEGRIGGCDKASGG